MKRIIYLTAILLFSLISFQSVFAIGQMTKPIDIKDVLRGQEVVETLILFNSEDKDATFYLKANGKIANWATFYATEDTSFKTPITEVNLLPKSQVQTIVRFNVPKDAPNGEYLGEVVVATKSSEEEGKQDEVSANVLETIGRTVKITVTDKEIVDLQAGIIPSDYGIASGDPLKIKIDYFNNGNVSMRPDVQLKITSEGTSVFNAIFPYPEQEESIKIKSRKTMSYVEWQTTGQKNGNYVAQVQILNNGKVIKEESFRFSIGYFKDDMWWILAVSFLGGGNMFLGWLAIGIILALIIGGINIFEKKVNFKKIF